MSATFKANDHVMCMHNGTFYSARVLDQKVKDGVQLYKVHYNGWNKKWDEWAQLGRIRKLEQETVTNKTYKKKSVAPPKGFGGKTKLVESESPNATKDGSDKMVKSQLATISQSAPTVSKIKEEIKDEKDASLVGLKKRGKRYSKISRALPEKLFVQHNKEIQIAMPDELKSMLIDDLNNVAKKNMLVEVPASKTIDKILEDYVLDRCLHSSEPMDTDEQSGGETAKSVFSFQTIQFTEDPNMKPENLRNISNNKGLYTEFAAGVTNYFNETLPSQLLYKFERIQLQELIDRVCKETSGNSDTKDSAKDCIVGATPMVENKKTSPVKFSSYYGVVHLLRLLTKLPTLFTYFDVEESLLRMLTFFIEDLQNFIKEHSETILNSVVYVQAPLEYHRRAT